MELIKNDFKAVIRHSQGIEEPKVDELFDTWLENKQEFIQRFDGSPIFEYGEVEIHITPEEKESKIHEFTDRVCRTYENSALADFIEVNKEGFFSNQVIEPYEDAGVVIPRGMKLVKAFKYFESRKEALMKLQNEASMIIQEDKISGILCFSVHPLDFLSLSQNNYNWRSCHSLDGEYRAGNLSYMGDSSTIICYLKAKNDAYIPGFPMPWNDKKWRMLLHFSEDRSVIFAGRPYPFAANADFFNTLDQALAKIGFNMFGWENWTNWRIKERFLYDEYIPIRGKLYALNDIIKDSPDHLHYNDLLYSTVYIPFYTSTYRCSTEKPIFNIGHDVMCLECGEGYISAGEETMRCMSCAEEHGEYGEYFVCDCCGRRMPLNEINYVMDDEYRICTSCYEEEMITCASCGEVFFKDSIIYDEITNNYICSSCLEQREEKRKEYNYH